MKQVIVMRTDLNMRKGKMIAQGAHASMLCILAGNYPGLFWQWALKGMKKICVRADSEDQLLDLHRKAIEAGLQSHIVTDHGLTEFNGVPTKTCIAIGPNDDDAVDAITSELVLL